METLSHQEAMARLDDFLLPVGSDTAALLQALVKGTKPRLILELGTSYGYSTAWLAAAARDYGARLITLELSEKKVAYARDAIARAGLAAVVDFRVGNALNILPGLPDSIDFVLIDLWKNLYVACLDAVYPKLASGAIVVADNMLQPESSRPEAAAYRRRVRELGLDSVLLPVGSGIELSRKTRAD